MYKIADYQSDTIMTVKPISYSSDSYEDTIINSNNSVIKNTIDTWYKNNLTSYSSYLADETFCSDRKVNSGSGYLTTGTTTYGAYGRLVLDQLPSIKCTQSNDKFNLSNPEAKLDYPISLITADEVAMAGGVYNTANNNYYLYDGQYSWTLSPSRYNSYYSYSGVWYIDSLGSLGPWNNVTLSFGTRTVINLKSDVVINSGDGTALNPYVVFATY